MKQRRVLIVRIVIAALALILSISALVLRIVDSESDNRQRAKEISAVEEKYIGTIAEYSGEEVCEVVVDLGAVMRSSTVSQTIRIVNKATTPHVLLDYTTQCRCMWLDFERESIAPNESVHIVLTFDSRGQWGSVSNYMEITTSTDNAPIVLWTGAEIE
jgi:hypothetical protein